MRQTILSLLLIYSSVFLSAINYTVITTNDSGAGSLRDAVVQANLSSSGYDLIEFALNTTDPNYNSEFGVWTIALLSELPMITTALITIDGDTQQDGFGDTNPNGPEINIIAGAELEYCFRIVAPINNIENLAISGFEFGIQVYGTMAYDIDISGNYFGTSADGLASLPNDYGIGISGNAYNIIIRDNIISGNSLAGIICSEAHDIGIYGNLIGTDRNGFLPLPNPTGIMLENAQDFLIGSTIVSDRNLISGNTDAGLMIYGTESQNNIVKGNYIGSDITATDTIPNGNGIMIVSSSGNLIGGPEETAFNVISGNLNCGVLINGTGANDNLVEGNFIGVDVTGNVALSNHYGVIIKADADNNRVGGTSSVYRNIISANHEIGVYIEASDNNLVCGNYIGTNKNGTDAFYYNEGVDSLIQANGVEINTLSKDNVIGGNEPGEGNLISGNRVYGAIYYGQVSENNIAGNFIGTDAAGSYAIPNATGICVDDASNNNIIENNLLSGNISYGLFIVTTGSNANVFRGNNVGMDYLGEYAIPNDVGLLIGGGAKYNIIGGDTENDRNIFSGNNYGGIEISDNGTDFNEIRGNYIGLEMSGTNLLPNNFGIGVSNLASGNIIENNTVSGNNTFGIVLSDDSDFTEIYGNNIGVAADGVFESENGIAGIAITSGSNNNIIGTVDNPNIIAYNDSLGIVIVDATSVRNKISGNSIFENEYLGIDIFPAGVNDNDDGDSDIGANNLMNYPVITDNWFDFDLWASFIEGTLDTENPESCQVELFTSDPYGVFSHGQGKYYIATAYPDATGYWIVQCADGVGGQEITAVAIDENGNTSEFAANFEHYTEVQNQVLFTDDFKIFPNPASGNFLISIPQTLENVEIKLYDCSGKFIQTLFEGKSDEKIINLNSVNLGMRTGMYLIRIVNNDSNLSILKLSIIE
jgi:titin